MSQTRRTQRVQLLDLVVAVSIAALATVVLLVPDLPWQLGWALGIPFLIVIPGYAIVAAVLPSRPGGSTTEAGQVPSPSWATRAGLSIIASTLVLAVAGVLLSLAGELRLTPIVVVIDMVVGAGTLVALTRRMRRTPEEPTVSGRSPQPRSLTSRLGLSSVQTLALTVATLVLLGSIAFVGGAPGSQSTHSEVTLLSEPDGVALGTTGAVTLTEGESNVVYLRVENHEAMETDYRVVAQLQRVGSDGTVIATERVDTASLTLQDGEVAVLESDLRPTLTGEDLRLRYLVYTETVPDDPTPDTATLSLRIWVNVVDGNTS